MVAFRDLHLHENYRCVAIISLVKSGVEMEGKKACCFAEEEVTQVRRAPTLYHQEYGNDCRSLSKI